MHIRQSALASMIIAVAAVALTAGAAQSPPAPGAPQAERYAFAEACKSCHAAIYESWSKSKHSRTIDRLSSSEQQQPCVVCHTTGGVGRIEREGKWVNRNVQCEACHGPAAAHAADPANREGLTKTPPAPVCEGCHNDKSPNFRGFVYAGMARLVHPLPK